jgi:hypothetical protein
LVGISCWKKGSFGRERVVFFVGNFDLFEVVFFSAKFSKMEEKKKWRKSLVVVLLIVSCWLAESNGKDRLMLAMKSAATITQRPLRPADRSQLKALHEDWFPVRYSEVVLSAVLAKLFILML